PRRPARARPEPGAPGSTAECSDGAGGGPATRRRGRLRPEDLRLLRRELLLGEDALVLQLRELLELRDRIGRNRGGRGRPGLRRRSLLVVLLLVLLGPAVGLAARDTVRDRGGGAGDDGGAGDPAEESGHGSCPLCAQCPVASRDASSVSCGM